MLRSLIFSAAFAALVAPANAGPMSDNFGNMANEVGSFMAGEVETVQSQLIDRPPVIRCACKQTCETIARISGGDVSQDIAEGELLIALQEDLSGGVAMVIRNGGKFDPKLIEIASVKLSYGKGVDPEQLAKLIGAAASAVLK